MVYPCLQISIPIIGQGQRPARKKTAKAAYTCRPGRKIDKTGLAAQFLHLVTILPVPFIIDEGPQVNAIALAQMLEQMIGTYFIALVRRIRNAMDEIKDFLHPSAQIFYDMRADEIRKP
jgi:hypothetical protein